MKLLACAAVLAAGVSVALAQPGIDCDGAHYPKYDDCEAVIKYFQLRKKDHVVAYNGQDGPEPSCTWWFWKDSNCRISTCWPVTNEHAGGRLDTTGINVARTYDGIKGVCQKLKAGGQWDGQPDEDGKIWTYTTVFNDPDQSPPSSAKLRSRDGAPTPDRFVQETVTLEQHEQWVNRTQQRPSKHNSGLHSRAVSATSAIAAIKREKGDDGWGINNTGKKFRQEGVFDTGPRANNGIKTTYSTTRSKTFTATTSANIGAAFEVFSAGISWEFSETDSFSVTKGYEFTPKCKRNQQGQAFFYPFFDYYDVTFSPSGQRVDVWLPVDAGDMFVKGEFEVQCLG